MLFQYVKIVRKKDSSKLVPAMGATFLERHEVRRLPFVAARESISDSSGAISDDGSGRSERRLQFGGCSSPAIADAQKDCQHGNRAATDFCDWTLAIRDDAHARAPLDGRSIRISKYAGHVHTEPFFGDALCAGPDAVVAVTQSAADG